MAKIAFKYILEDSHTWIKLEEDAPKTKVVTGEIIEIEEKLVNKMRMYLGGFRRVGEDGEAKVEQFDAVNAENAEKAAEEAKKAEKEAKKAAKEAEKEAEGNKVPEIVPPIVAPIVENEEAKKAETPVDYTTLKQPELKAEMEKRGLPVPTGIVANAALIEALVADDTAKAGTPAVETEVKNDGSDAVTVTVTQ